MPTDQPLSSLSTKLHLPPLRADALLRMRLLERLETGAREGRTLTLVSAPAGFGKTTLISAWLQHSRRPSAWLSLDASDDDPVRFWRYVSAALQTLDARWGASALAMLAAPQAPPLESAVTALINDLVVSAATAPIVLVVDDYHVVTDLGIHTSLDFFLDHVPPQLHVAITTREDPPLSLPRRRARQKLTEVRAADLRFTLSEATELLNSIMRLGLTSADIAALEQRTEGWSAGLQMAPSLQGRTDQHDFIAAFAGDDRFTSPTICWKSHSAPATAVQDFLVKARSCRASTPRCATLLVRRDSRAVLADRPGESLHRAAGQSRGGMLYHLGDPCQRR
jgi:LuxR family maltose regulon positive regulatory protein